MDRIQVHKNTKAQSEIIAGKMIRTKKIMNNRELKNKQLHSTGKKKGFSTKER